MGNCCLSVFARGSEHHHHFSGDEDDNRNEPLLPKTYRPHSFSHEAKVLAEACAEGDYDKVQMLLSENTSIHINEADNLGLTALYSAALYNHMQICHLLLEMGADPNIANKNGETPLHVACKSGHFEMCRLMIQFGADCEFRFRGRSCLDLAVQGNYPMLVRFFLAICPHLLRSSDGQQQQQLNSSFSSPRSPSSSFSMSRNSFQLSSSSSNSATGSVFGGNSLMNGSIGSLMSSSSMTTHVNQSELEMKDKTAPTALIIASSLNHVEILKILLQHEPAVDLVDANSGKSCIMIACERGHHKIVHLFLSRNRHSLLAILNQVNIKENDWSCVHYAAVNNSIKCMQIIAHYSGEQRSIWSELKDKNGRTPLHLASLYGHFDFVRCLLDYGVRTDMQDNDGKVPADLASATLHYHQVMKVFREFAQKNNPPAGPYTHQRYPSATLRGHAPAYL